MLTLRHDTSDSISAVALAADGRIAAGTSGGEVVIWDSLDREPTVYPRRRKGRGSVVQGLTFLPGGECLVVADNGRITLGPEDAKQDRVLRTDGPVHWHSFDPTGDLVAVSEGYALQVWDVAAGRLLWRRVLDARTAGALAFDATRRAVIVTEATLQFWSPTDNRLIADLGPLPRRPHALACSPDGRWLVASFGDAFRVWDVAAKAIVRDVPVSGQLQFTALTFCPDGRLMTVGSRGLVQFWDPAAWAESAAFAWAVGWTRACAVAADGLTAAVGGNLGYVAVWDVDG